jgi:integrase
MAKPVKVELGDGSTRSRVKVSLGYDPSGKRVQRTLSAPTLRELDKLVTAAKQSRLTGEARASTTTLHEYFTNDWLPHVRASGIRAATIGKYERVTRLHLIPAFGRSTLSKLTTVAIQRWVHGQAGTPATVRHRLAVLDMALAQAVRWRLLNRNPADGVRGPADGPRKQTTWTIVQLDHFLLVTHDSPYHAVYCLLGRCGLRIGETLALQWGDLELTSSIVWVRRTLTQDEGGCEVVGETTKTGETRAVLLDAQTVAALRDVPKRAGWVFPRLRDLLQPMDKRTISAALRRDVARSGLPPLTPHGLRHTHSTHMMERGVHPTVAMARLGHKSVAMIQRYSHPRIEHQADVIDRLSGQVRQESSG